MKKIALLLILCTPLAGCFASSDADESEQRAADPSPAADSPPTADTAQQSAAPTILEAFETWNGNLVCEYREYASGSTIFYDGDTLQCEIQLPFIEGLNTTTDDLRRLEANRMSAQFGPNGESFDVMTLFANAELPNVLRLEIHPPASSGMLAIRYDESEEPATFRVERYEPLTYSVEPQFDHDPEHRADGIRQYLELGETYTYHVRFSQEMDRKSVEEKLTLRLADLLRTIEWHSDQSLTFSLRADETYGPHAPYEEIVLDFYGAKTAEGIVHFEQEDASRHLRFQITRPKQYALVDPESGRTTPLFESLISYPLIDPAPGGAWLLAEELRSNESILTPTYTVVTRDGTRVKTLTGAETPEWIDEHTLLYEVDRSVIQYNVQTGQRRIIWSKSEPPAVVSFAYERESRKLIVAAADHDDKGAAPVDLYLFDNLDSTQPRVLNDAFLAPDPMAWDAVRYKLPVSFVEDAALFWEDHAHNDPTSRPKAVVMQWHGGARNELPMASRWIPLSGGKLLRQTDDTWNVYDIETGRNVPLLKNLENDEWMDVSSLGSGDFVLALSDAKLFIFDTDSNALRTTSFVDETTLLTRTSPDGFVIVSSHAP